MMRDQIVLSALMVLLSPGLAAAQVSGTTAATAGAAVEGTAALSKGAGSPMDWTSEVAPPPGVEMLGALNASEVILAHEIERQKRLNELVQARLDFKLLQEKLAAPARVPGVLPPAAPAPAASEVAMAAGAKVEKKQPSADALSLPVLRIYGDDDKHLAADVLLANGTFFTVRSGSVIPGYGKVTSVHMDHLQIGEQTVSIGVPPRLAGR